MLPEDRRERMRRYRLWLVVGSLLLVTWTLWTAREALFPFIIGLTVAYLLQPLVNRVQRMIPPRGVLVRIRRTLAVIVVYGVALGVLGLSLYVFGTRIAHETIDLVENMPGYVDMARDEFQSWNDWYLETIPASVRLKIEENLDEAGRVASSAIQATLLATVGTVQRAVGLIAGLALLPLWIFYLLKDQGKAFDFFYRLWPRPLQRDVRNIVGIVDGVLGSYIRAQLFLGVVVGVVTLIGLVVLDIKYAAPLAILAGIFEMVPILGPWLSFIAAAIVVLATDPEKIWIVAILFLLIQQVENTFLVPKIQGDAVDINPAVIMVLLVVGGALMGVIGVVAVVPLAAIARDVFIYVYNRLTEEAHSSDALPPHG
ncbi:MAG TPA: AI-2E family transporter, partial [Thermomicrobiales bacterium]|nr:AI-2E family transporter [Thermomicrobiales bacterium]